MADMTALEEGCAAAAAAVAPGTEEFEEEVAADCDVADLGAGLTADKGAAGGGLGEGDAGRAKGCICNGLCTGLC
jgi:hypothetical protein